MGRLRQVRLGPHQTLPSRVYRAAGEIRPGSPLTVQLADQALRAPGVRRKPPRSAFQADDVSSILIARSNFDLYLCRSRLA